MALQRPFSKFQQKETLRAYTDLYVFLLHLEEVQMQEDIRRYNMEGVTFSRHGKYLHMSVSGLLEKRPSVLRADRIYACLPGTDFQGRQWQGVVHDVQRDEVGLCFHPTFHRSHTAGKQCHVRFTFTRTMN